MKQRRRTAGERSSAPGQGPPEQGRAAGAQPQHEPAPRVPGRELPRWVFAEHMKTSEEARGPAGHPGPHDDSEITSNDFPDEQSALARAVASNQVCDPARGELEAASFDPEERSAELHLRGSSRVGGAVEKGKADRDSEKSSADES